MVTGMKISDAEVFDIALNAEIRTKKLMKKWLL